jgi:hypothetical protein
MTVAQQVSANAESVAASIAPEEPPLFFENRVPDLFSVRLKCVCSIIVSSFWFWLLPAPIVVDLHHVIEPA